MKKTATVLVAIILSIGAIDLASPYLTIARLKAAVDRRDGHAVAGFIDFPAVQASLSSQLEQRFAAMVAADRGKSTARTVSGIFGMLFSNKVVQVVVTEEMLARLIRGTDGITLPSAEPATVHFDPKRYRVRRTSFSEFWVCPADAQRDVALRFHRTFPNWKIAQIALPRKLSSADGASRAGCG